MKRTAVAAAWILGSTLPLLAATVFLFGCCAVVAAHHVRRHLANRHQLVEEPVKRIATLMPQTFRLTMSPASAARFAPASEIAFRSFVSLGAVRCDQDVGLHVLVQTFRI